MFKFNKMAIIASPKHYAQAVEARGVDVDFDLLLDRLGDEFYQRGPFYVYVAAWRLFLVLDTHWTMDKTYVVKTIYPVSGLATVANKRAARPDYPMAMISSL